MTGVQTCALPICLVISLAAVALGAAIVGGALWGLRQIYFLGTDSGGRAALYRGLPYNMPLGIELYSEVYSVPVQVASLPLDRRESAVDHELRGRDDAVSLLNDLEDSARIPTVAPPTNQAGNGGAQQQGGGGGKSPPQGSGTKKR